MSEKKRMPIRVLIADDEAEPFVCGIELDRADLLDGRLIRRSMRWPLRSRPPGLLLERRGRINAHDLGYLHTFLTRPRADLERGRVARHCCRYVRPR